MNKATSMIDGNSGTLLEILEYRSVILTAARSCRSLGMAPFVKCVSMLLRPA
jgi:hypothetical protein